VKAGSDIAELRVNDALWILEPIARHMGRRYPVIEHDELVSVGYIALRKASETFDATLGVAFSSYGWTRVSGAMMDVVRKQVTLRNRMHHAGLQAITLLDDVGDVMRDDEPQHRATAQDLFLAVAAAMRANVLSNHSAEQVHGDLDERLDRTRAATALSAAFKRIAPEQARLIELHYQQSVTLRSIAGQLDISYRTVKRRHNEALRALAEALRRPRDRPRDRQLPQR